LTSPHASDARRGQPFRFFDNREKYLLFVNTCNEKQVISDRIGLEMAYIRPSPPALRVFDAGMGDGTVLASVARFLHHRFPDLPLLLVAKEASHEDVRLGLEKMPDRFHEHPRTVLALTNLFYSEAPALWPNSSAMQAQLDWRVAPLDGASAYEFEQQMREMEPDIQEWWQTKPSPRSGNPVYVRPSVLVIYRRDQEAALGGVIPEQGDAAREYDLVIAAQPFRARLDAATKARTVLVPLAASLAPDGLAVVIQSTGKDPGMEVIRDVWPGENPFHTPRQELLRELKIQLGDSRPDLRFLSYMDSRAEFRFSLRLRAGEVNSVIGTSTTLAAWNAATYVAQIEDQRLSQAMTHSAYLDVTQAVLKKYGGLWFTDESFLITRVSNP